MNEKLEKFFSPESSKDSFAEKKEKVADFLRREAKGETGSGFYENEGKLDESIKNITIKMNRLPFLYTIQACGGHIFVRGLKRARHQNAEPEHLSLPPGTTVFYAPGNISFETKGDIQSQNFISKLKELVSKFEGVTLFDPHTDIKPDQLKKLPYVPYVPYMLELGKSVGRRHIDIQQARELESKREKFKLELEKFIDGFLQKNE